MRRSDGAADAKSPALLSGRLPPTAWAHQPRWCVLQTDFGPGRDFLATWAAWRDDPARPRMLHFIGHAAQPAPADALLPAAASDPQLAPLARQLAAQWHGLLPGVHRLAFEEGRVLLTLYIGDLQALLRQQQPLADSVYLGAQGPPASPAAEPNLHDLKGLARCCRRGTGLASASDSPALRASLAACGFLLQGVGDGGARLAWEAMPASGLLQATFDPPWQPRAGRPVLPAVALAPGQLPGHCLVVGAGLAGSAVADSLARRGWRVTVLDAADTPAAGASGLPAGVFASHVSPDDSLLSRLSRAGVRCTLQALARCMPDGRGTQWSDGGVLEHDPTAPPRLAWTQGPGLDWSRPASAQQLQDSGLPAQAPTCWHPLGGWVRPAQLVRRLLAQPGIAWRGGARVARLEHQEGQWRALDAAGQPLAQGEMVVVCAGPASAEVAGRPVPLQWLRGQIAWGLHGQAPAHAPFPPQPVNGHGNLVPRVPLDWAHGVPGWVLGSTFERDQGTLPVSMADRQAGLVHNLEQLRALLPLLGDALAPAFAQALSGGEDTAGPVRTWAAVRCAAPDRLPIAGPLDTQALPGLWLSTAMGARGLTLALLCAELLAARLHGEPLPLEARLAQALGSERLI